MSKKYALIVGSSLFSSEALSTAETGFLEVDDDILYYKRLRSSDDSEIILVQRHKATSGADYFPPHLIKYHVIMKGLKKLNVTDIIAFCSVGSLKPIVSEFQLGKVIIPDDFFCPWDIRTSLNNYKSHRVPGFSEEITKHVIEVFKNNDIEYHHGGVYGNTKGPRFETKAEIRFLSNYADIVGMTAAHEATIAMEQDIGYAMICIIDNWGNGLEPANDSKLSLEKFKVLQKQNQANIENIFRLITKSLNVNADFDYDLVVTADYVVTMNATNDIFKNGFVAVKDGKIAEIGTIESFGKEFKARYVLHKGKSVLIPGLINSHTHASMSYLSGVGSDLELKKWLQECIWPIETNLVNFQYVYDSTILAIAEMILSGTTCFNDMYFFPEATLKAAAETGIRAVIGAIAIDFPSNYASEAEQYYKKGKEMISSNFGKFPNVSFAVAVHSNYAAGESSILRSKSLADKYQLPLHIHLHETRHEVEEFVENTSETPIAQLNRLGLLNDKLIAVHMTHVSEEEIKLCAAKGVSVVHCPFSNLKLASGFCPVNKLVGAGINVALGTDGAASNNSLDMLGEIKLAACLAKAVAQKATALPEVEALRMATINGARALHLDNTIGSLEIGKEADFVALNLDAVNMLPLYDVISQIVYSASRENVTDVWVGGVQLLKNRNLTTISLVDQKNRLEEHEKRIREILLTHGHLKA